MFFMVEKVLIKNETHQRTYLTQQFQPLVYYPTNKIKKHKSCTFIIHMTNINCLKIWDPKMLFLVAELKNKMIEQYQTTGVKYHFHPVSLISIKHLIHQHTTASRHCNPKQSMIKTGNQ